MNFDLFCKKTKKNCKTAITFAYDVEKKCLIYQKNYRKIGTQFHQGLPGEVFSDSQNSESKKSYFKSKKI